MKLQKKYIFFDNINSFVSLLEFQKKFFLASLISYILDVFIFSFFRSSLGTNRSAVSSFFFSQTILFLILFFFLKNRFNLKITGYIKQLGIGLGSLFIHLLILNIIDFYVYNFHQNFYISIYKSSLFISIGLKITCGLFGYLWSSTMTSKYTFR